MRVTTNTEAAVREMFQEKINQGIMTANDANRLYRYAYSNVLVTISNWRRRNAKPEAIEAAISRRIKAARMAIAQASSQDARARAQRDMVVAQMFAAVWKGMQADVAAYQDR